VLLYTQAVDVYAFAIVCWELLEMKEPWADNRSLHSLSDLNDAVLRGVRPKISPASKREAPKAYLDLILKCWDPKPQRRPGFGSIVDVLTQAMNSLS